MNLRWLWTAIVEIAKHKRNYWCYHHPCPRVCPQERNLMIMQWQKNDTVTIIAAYLLRLCPRPLITMTILCHQSKASEATSMSHWQAMSQIPWWSVDYSLFVHFCGISSDYGDTDSLRFDWLCLTTGLRLSPASQTIVYISNTKTVISYLSIICFSVNFITGFISTV
jgi:site-specific recombinase